MKFTVDRIDHVVLTCADPEATASWYERVLGMERDEFGEGRIAMRFGSQKLNLHRQGAEFSPHATAPRTGSLDLCFVTALGADDVVVHLKSQKIAIVEGPANKIGALGMIRSVYCRDPDGNLIEISTYLDD
jgi:catechol 2,3-dioxygenase-like lactoylglutathione lyase family enzyme